MYNKFDSPLSEASYRAALLALGTVVFVTIMTYLTDPTITTVDEGERWKQAFLRGLIAGIAPLIGRSAIEGGADQKRASAGSLAPADPAVYYVKQSNASAATVADRITNAVG